LTVHSLKLLLHQKRASSLHPQIQVNIQTSDRSIHMRNRKRLTFDTGHFRFRHIRTLYPIYQNPFAQTHPPCLASSLLFIASFFFCFFCNPISWFARETSRSMLVYVLQRHHLFYHRYDKEMIKYCNMTSINHLSI
jgi:hypothetical protein